MNLGLCRPEACTWVVSGIYVRVVIYMVKLARYGTRGNLIQDLSISKYKHM